MTAAVHSLGRLVASARESLPQGRTLPADVWERRHAGILYLLGLHAVALAAVSIVSGQGLLHSAGHSVPLAGLALLAANRRIGRKLRAAIASTGLVTASALIVHFSGGVIEAHFHFFVMVAVVTLYEDWVPFVLAFAYVVVHHGGVGVLDSTGVYNHADAQAHPWRWAAIHGVFVIGAGAANVVTWRLNEGVRERIRDTEHRARESEDRLAAIVESSDDAILSASLDGVVTSWNAGAERLYGYRADEIVGQSIALLYPPDTFAAERGAITRTALAGESVHHFETERVRKDGSRVPVSLSISPIKDETGKTIGTAGIARDITAQHADAAERERILEREREQVERLRTLDRLKDEFIALVSHELRTPLTSIRGYVELMIEGAVGEPSSEQARLLGVVDRNAHRLEQLVGDLLFIAQIEAGRLQLESGPVELEQIAAEAVETGLPLADQKGLELTLDVNPVPTLVGDRVRLGQLLDNFVSNAIKFTAAGGIEVRLRAQDAWVVLEVADTGMGIPEAEQEQLFERFFRSSTATAQAIQGTGLGLAISKAIAEAHGGRISFTSVENEGTTFRVELPLRAALKEAA
jgi:PAS domain S-box-containing protein